MLRDARKTLRQKMAPGEEQENEEDEDDQEVLDGSPIMEHWKRFGEGRRSLSGESNHG